MDVDDPVRVARRSPPATGSACSGRARRARRRGRRASPSTASLLAGRRRLTGRCTNGTPRPAHSAAWSGWLATTTRTSHGSSPDDQRTSRSARQCGWRDARSAVGSGRSVKRTSAAHAEALGDRGERRGDLVAAEREPVELELDALEEHLRSSSSTSRCWSAWRMLPPWSATKLATAATSPAGRRTTAAARRSVAVGGAVMRTAMLADGARGRQSPTAAAAFSESTPAASGMRTRSAARGEHRRRQPARSLPIDDRAARRRVDGVESRAPASGVSPYGRERRAGRARRPWRRRRRRGRGGGRTPCPSRPAASAGRAGRRCRGRAGGRPSRGRRRCGRSRRCSPGCRRPRRRRAGRRSPSATLGDAGARALEQGDDRLRDAEAGDVPADRGPGGEDVDAEPAGDRRARARGRRARRPAGTRRRGPARRRGRPRRGTTGAAQLPVVAPDAAGEPAAREPEPGEPGIGRDRRRAIVERRDVRSGTGTPDQSGGRFSGRRRGPRRPRRCT